MEIKFSNYIDKVRANLENVIYNIDYNAKSYADYNLGIINYFLYLKKTNYTAYTQLLGLAISDQYKLLYYKNEVSILDEEEQLNFDLLSDFHDNKDLVHLFEEENIFILNAINGLIEYDMLDYFNKRETLKVCTPIGRKLIKFSALNIYDFLYYNPNPYNIGFLKMIYDDCIKNDETKEEAIESLISTLDEIYITSNDKSEYMNLISDLLTSYYIIGKYELSLKKGLPKKDRLTKTIKFLESSDTLEIIQQLYEKDYSQNNKFLIEIFKRYINFKKQNFTYKDDNEIYQKTLNKLKNIKEFYNERNNHFNS